ncbi:BTB/POZ and MATH domain-containing protein 5 [Carex littledalei]|uniref:BTB/POZ and MATH domain-containing protein 5 n=1 Tax=Carex littledalei TaxID=544730 RepID=A0A833R8X0_9POAL|nr:BTB/POZ and MATH domain-containing protein 5 [Carex littledalei]
MAKEAINAIALPLVTYTIGAKGHPMFLPLRSSLSLSFPLKLLSVNQQALLPVSSEVMDSLSIVAATGCYQFKINYSKTKDMGIGKLITSPKFRVGQHDWVIYYYPQGENKDYNGKYVSIYLKLEREFVDVTAEFYFELLDKNGNVSLTTSKLLHHKFTSKKINWGLCDFFERTKLEQTYIKDDCFILRLSITIDSAMSMSSTAFLQHLLVAADRYAVETLKVLCQRKLVESISLDTVLSTLELAEIHNCSKLKNECLRFLDNGNLVSLRLTEGNDTYINNKKKENTSNSVLPDSLGESEPESIYSLEITKRGEEEGKVEEKRLIGEEEKKEDNGISQ